MAATAAITFAHSPDGSRSERTVHGGAEKQTPTHARLLPQALERRVLGYQFCTVLRERRVTHVSGMDLPKLARLTRFERVSRLMAFSSMTGRWKNRLWSVA